MHLEINAAGAQGIKKDTHTQTHTKPIREREKKENTKKGKAEGQLVTSPSDSS